jgi:hypothetical protein
MHDGNVAFKVTWVYGPRGPFTGPCTAEGREFNIVREGKVWCSDADSKCAQILHAGNLDKLPADYQPCYDVAIFTDWSFGGGVYHNGERRGQPISINHARAGKLAFFTSKRHDMNERDRVVIGCFEIDHFDPEADPDWGVVITSVPASRIRLRDFEFAPRFWDFHSQNGLPRWGCGLFRYLPESEALGLQDAVKAAAYKERAKKR